MIIPFCEGVKKAFEHHETKEKLTKMFEE